MKVEVLVAAVNQKDFGLIKKMNLQSDAVIANQCDSFSYQLKETEQGTIKMITTAERGVGKNRNTALIHATGNILLMADDDMEYVEGYANALVKAFEDNPKADIIVFNLTRDSGRKMIVKKHKVRFYNYMRYGAVRIAAKKSSLDKANVWFSMLYGGGAKYSSGEDSLFFRECMKKKLRIYAIPDVLAKLTDDRPSTWNTGNKLKQAFDKGIWLKNAYPNLCRILAYIFAYKMKTAEFGYKKTLKEIKKGIRQFKEV